VDGFFDVVVRLVDMFQGAVLQPLSEAVVFIFGHVMVGLVEQFQGTVETAAPIHMGIDRWMIVQVLVVVDRRSFDLCDGSVNFFDGLDFLLLAFPAGAFQMSSGVTQIG
jgi:hypothetical protein